MEDRRTTTTPADAYPPVTVALDSLAVRRLLDRKVPLTEIIDFAAQLTAAARRSVDADLQRLCDSSVFASNERDEPAQSV